MNFWSENCKNHEFYKNFKCGKFTDEKNIEFYIFSLYCNLFLIYPFPTNNTLIS